VDGGGVGDVGDVGLSPVQAETISARTTRVKILTLCVFMDVFQSIKKDFSGCTKARKSQQRVLIRERNAAPGRSGEIRDYAE